MILTTVRMGEFAALAPVGDPDTALGDCVRRKSDAIARLLLALLLLCFVSLHAALPAMASAGEPDKTMSIMVSDAAQADDDASMSPDPAAKCHDSCNWLAKWHVPALHPATLSSPEKSARAVPSGLVFLISPPPR